MTLLLIIIVIIVLIALFRFMSYSEPKGPAYVPPKTSGNKPFPEQTKIKENQEYYDRMVLSSRYNFNDWLNIHPGDENIGEYGEFLTLKKIVACCKRYDGYYKILRNVYLQTKNGTTEVDSILLHETGIYVFESKNYSGWIFGNYQQKEWTQAINRYTKNHFYNPIWQNEGHIAALKTILGNDLKYFSFIVFSERCVLKDVPDDIPGRTILRRHNLESLLFSAFSSNSTSTSGESYFKIDQIDELYAKLLPHSNVSEEEKAAHIQQIKNKQIGD
ncbi:MAG: NERD domain-containing protein [Candidatus Saccharibacteria bacterium]|nr:NERD domain-containing protein [Candidatus Saccharibacteria bacterium]